MQSDLLASLRRLSDAELVARVQDLAAGERGVTVLLVAHLAELDTRDVHFRAGHGSLFAYCRNVLSLSEQEAYSRIAVGRAARRFPVILELLEGGALSLTTVRLLAPHLTPANHKSVLESARGKSKLQVEEIAAALWPRPDAPSLVRKLPAPRLPAPAPYDSVTGLPSDQTSSASSCDRPLSSPDLAPSSPAGYDATPAPLARSGSPLATGRQPPAGSWHGAATATPSLPAPPLPAARRSAEVTPLSPDRYKVQVTIGGDTLEKLRLAKDMLRHAIPSGDEAAILDRALTALLADLAKKKFAAAEKPRPSCGTAPGSRHVPAEVKRTVWLRDLGRCAFVGTNGRRCPERGFLEFHYVQPHAVGGEASVGNVQLRCRCHNGYEARVYFGQGRVTGGGGLVRERSAPYGLRPFATHASGTRSGTRSGPDAPAPMSFGPR